LVYSILNKIRFFFGKTGLYNYGYSGEHYVNRVHINTVSTVPLPFFQIGSGAVTVKEMGKRHKKGCIAAASFDPN
jgi:hypothetical protein